MAFEKMLLSEYQINYIKKGLVVFLICPIRFSNLPGFNRPFRPVEMRDGLEKASFENLQKRMQTTKKISLGSPFQQL